MLAAIAERPDVRIREMTREDLGDGAWRITAVIENHGSLPVLTANAERTRRFGTPRWELVTGDGSTLVIGERRGRLANLDARVGKAELQWIVTGAAGATVALEIGMDPIGSLRAEVTL